jgi:hypothetical protein
MNGLPAWTAHSEYQEVWADLPGQALHRGMTVLLPGVQDPLKTVHYTAWPDVQAA